MTPRFRALLFAAFTLCFAVLAAGGGWWWLQQPAPEADTPVKTNQPTLPSVLMNPLQISGLPQETAQTPRALQLNAKPSLIVQGQGSWEDGAKRFFEHFAKLRALASSLNLSFEGHPYVYYTELEPAGYRFQAGYALRDLPANFVPPDGIVLAKTPEGVALQLTHRGDYASISETYEVLDEFAAKEGLRDRGEYVEQFLDVGADGQGEGASVNIYALLP